MRGCRRSNGARRRHTDVAAHFLAARRRGQQRLDLRANICVEPRAVAAEVAQCFAVEPLRLQARKTLQLVHDAPPILEQAVEVHVARRHRRRNRADLAAEGFAHAFQARAQALGSPG